MSNWVKGLVLRLMRVPPQPQPPEGSPESVRMFLAGQNYFRLRILLWAMLQSVILITIVGLMFIPAPRKRPPEILFTIWHATEALLVAGFALSLPITYFKQRLDYEMRWYIVTDRSLRIRSGIWSTQELTMTFANVQNIRVKAGPLQRLLGLADLEVDSAGGGDATSGYGHSHSARFDGVDNAEMVRDLIVERLRQYRDAGLGDPDDPGHSGSASAEEAAASVLGEVRGLRTLLTITR
jgi:membrane protein YdbS with pleckstrin-like domain